MQFRVDFAEVNHSPKCTILTLDLLKRVIYSSPFVFKCGALFSKFYTTLNVKYNLV